MKKKTVRKNKSSLPKKNDGGSPPLRDIANNLVKTLSFQKGTLFNKNRSMMRGWQDDTGDATLYPTKSWTNLKGERKSKFVKNKK